jgi:hypothetical protein
VILRTLSLIAAGVGGLVSSVMAGEPAPTVVDDRAAIELVYYHHRTGTKQPFEQALPAAQIARLVALELRKEAVLKRVYGVSVTDAMVEVEVRRINETTRAPDVLAELKAALGDDLARFSRSMARPIVVERTLRTRFESDDKLHATERAKVEALRLTLLKERDGTYSSRFALVKAAGLGDAPELTWQLAPRPAADAASVTPSAPSTPTEAKARRSAYSIEATAQVAQVLASPEKNAQASERTLYFEELPVELQNLLRARLRKPGDVSAVIETTRGFLLYLAESRTDDTVAAAVLSLPKRSYEEWLATAAD